MAKLTPEEIAAAKQALEDKKKNDHKGHLIWEKGMAPEDAQEEVDGIDWD